MKASVNANARRHRVLQASKQQESVNPGAHPWTLVTFLQVRCGSASRVWRCGVSVWCYRLAGRPVREGLEGCASANSQPASNLSVQYVTPAFDQPRSPALPSHIVCHLLESGNESAAPRGTSQTCLNTFPSHIPCVLRYSGLTSDCVSVYVATPVSHVQSAHVQAAPGGRRPVTVLTPRLPARWGGRRAGRSRALDWVDGRRGDTSCTDVLHLHSH